MLLLLPINTIPLSKTSVYSGIFNLPFLRIFMPLSIYRCTEHTFHFHNRYCIWQRCICICVVNLSSITIRIYIWVKREPLSLCFYVSQFTVEAYCFADSLFLCKQPWSIIYHSNWYGAEIIKKCTSVCLFICLLSYEEFLFIRH